MFWTDRRTFKSPAVAAVAKAGSIQYAPKKTKPTLKMAKGKKK